MITLRFHNAASGRTYEVPLAYHRRGGGMLEAVTSRRGRWWRNLVSHPNAEAVYRGRTHAAHVDVIVDDLASIEQALRSRDVWRRWLVPVVAQDTVLLRITLGSSRWRRERGRLV